MNGKTMKLLVEYIADQHRKERERWAKTYSNIYKKTNINEQSKESNKE